MSVRALVADPAYQRYFQHIDKEMCVKIVEGCVLDSIIDFLDGKGVDTKALVSQQTTILNNGVMVTGGGKLESESIAVGEKATVRKRVQFGADQKQGGGEA
jgi:hypothetical protein